MRIAALEAGKDQMSDVRCQVNCQRSEIGDQRSALGKEGRLVEARRLEIAENARITLQAINERGAKYGSVEDLKRDLKG